MSYFTVYVFSVQEYGDDEITAGMIAHKIISLNNNDPKGPFYPLVDVYSDESLYNFVDNETQCDLKTPSDEDAKIEYSWYAHDHDMLLLSKEFPTVTFKLHGRGEDYGDVWDTYYRNGKMCTYTLPLEMPPFNEKDLREPIATESTIFNI